MGLCHFCSLSFCILEQDSAIATATFVFEKIISCPPRHKGDARNEKDIFVFDALIIIALDPGMPIVVVFNEMHS